MIFGIGADLVSIERIARALERHGERLARRILTASEHAELQTAADPAAFLAKRFAAKEAVAKALGTGLAQGLVLREIGVAHDARGKPIIVLGDTAKAVWQREGAGAGHLSLSDDQGYALAFVVIERP
jgi:holo-[acyl-carrier protein] synthase